MHSRRRLLKARTVLLGVTVLALAAALLAAGPATVQAQRALELTLGHGFSPEHPIHREVLVPFADELDIRSNGRIKVTIIPGGALAGAAETYESVVAGVMDIGWTLQSYTPGRFPLTEVIEVPFLFWTDPQQPTRVLWQLFERSEHLQREYGDVKVLGLWSSDPRGVMTRERPIRRLEDFQGQRIRALGAMEFAVLEAFGGVPLGMPAPDMYDALERGVMDGTSIGLSAVASYHLYEVIRHVTITNHGAGAQMLVMNRDVWNSLSPEDQAIIDQVAGERLSLMAAAEYDRQYQTGLQAIRANNIGVHFLPEEDLQRWREMTEPLAMDSWLEQYEGRGAREVYELMLELAEQV